MCNERTMQGWQIVDSKTGQEMVLERDYQTFKGEWVTLKGFRPPHKPSSTGRVLVVEANNPYGVWHEFFPGVIDATIVREE